MITVVKPGLFTTVQDLGRRGYQSVGVSPSGVMDEFSGRIANLLVGNPEQAPLLECTLVGPILVAEVDVWAAVYGAKVAGVPPGRPFRWKSGERLSLELIQGGCRAYLAVAGGFDVPRVLGSASTHVSAQLGGFRGRPLREGDTLPVERPHSALRSEKIDWWVSDRLLDEDGELDAIRFAEGHQTPLFAEEAVTDFTAGTFTVSGRSNRMGLRLNGPVIASPDLQELNSEPVVTGTIQVPPDGHPIILMSDRQTIGGYPKIGTVIRADLGRLAQRRPGESLFFDSVTLAEAREAAAEREYAFGVIKAGLAERFQRLAE